MNYHLPYQAELEAMSTISLGGADPAAHWHKTFRTHIVYQNVCIPELYYRRIHGKRLECLLGMDPVVIEAEIASMVSDGSVYANIDGPSDII